MAVWGVFSLIATGFQWGLDRAGLLSETMASGNVVLAAFLLFAAGVYQLTPWKQASPAALPGRRWSFSRDIGGGVTLGPMRAPRAWHGTFCLGCCWMLMGLLFVGGLMNSALDRRTGASGADREAVSTRSPREPTYWRRLDWLGACSFSSAESVGPEVCPKKSAANMRVLQPPCAT